MCKRPAPWKARWLKLQGGRASATAGLPAMAPTVKRGSRLPILSAQTAKVVFPGQAACSARLPKIAVSAGAERQRVWGGQPPRHGCRVGTRVPVAPCRRRRWGWLPCQGAKKACRSARTRMTDAARMGLIDFTIKLLGLSETLHRWRGLIKALDAGRREKVARYAERIAETLGRAAHALAALEKEPGSAR